LPEKQAPKIDILKRKGTTAEGGHKPKTLNN